MPNEEKKQPDTRPRLMPEEIVARYELLKEQQWDAPRRAFRDPTVIFHALIDLGRLTAARLFDGLRAHAAWILRIEKRVDVLEDFKRQLEELNDQIEARMKAEVLPRPPIEEPAKRPAVVLDAVPREKPKKNGKLLSAVASVPPPPVAETAEPPKESA